MLYTSDLASIQHVLPWMVNVIQIGLYSVLTLQYCDERGFLVPKPESSADLEAENDASTLVSDSEEGGSQPIRSN